MRLFDWLFDLVETPLPPADPHEHDIAKRAYADCLEAQLIGLDLPGGADLIARLRGDENGPPPFPVIMGVETQLAMLMSDDQLARQYWVVRDRFERVGAPPAIARHDQFLPTPASTTGTTDPDPASTDADPPATDAPAIDPAALAIAAENRESDERRTIAHDLAGTQATDSPAAAADDAPDPAPPPADATTDVETR